MEKLRSAVGRNVELPFTSLDVRNAVEFWFSGVALDESLALSALISDHMPRLERLSLWNVYDIAPGFFELIGCGCPKLKQLHFDGFSLQPETEVNI